ncbi:beta-N-acetylhexosaminidase [Confluentibacter flavum]|nr:beta-N-acetylhexosaminidase [Confluentibacter flavum]
MLLVSFGLAFGQVERVTSVDISDTGGKSFKYDIIPRPNHIKAMDGNFLISSNTIILYDGEEAKSVALYLSDYLTVTIGKNLKVSSLPVNKNREGHILITTEGKTIKTDAEDYELVVSPKNIFLKAQSRKGLFYAVQSFLQLMPVEVFSDKEQENVIWSIPCVEIKDAPALSWRGYMLDVSRHFFSKETILRQIDLLALYKINRFHLHLTDDQGWRVEIKKYPKLTEIGAWNILDNGKKQGGFYTQKDLKEIVEYAKEREVMIIPEIDMPGHSLAAVAAYPELSCHGNPVAVMTKAGISADNMCPSNEKVYEFVNDVLKEIVGIFPSPYIHIGGDEAQKSNWMKCPRCTSKAGVTKNSSDKADREKIYALQDEFIGRVKTLVKQHDKIMIGWDEIIENEHIENIEGAIIQSWRSAYPGFRAAEKGHKIILSSGTTFYLDYPNGQRNIERIYNTVVPDKYWKHFFNRENIIGVECPLWTESVSNQREVDYMTWPRMLALAEVGWTDMSYRSYGEFKSRLRENEKRLDLLGVNYQKIDGEKLACQWKPEDTPENEVLEYDITGIIDKPGKWEVAFVYEGGKQGLNTEGFEIVQNNKVIAFCNSQQSLGWRDTSPVNIVNVESVDPNMKQTLRIKLLRDEKLQGESLDGLGSVWFTYK